MYQALPVEARRRITQLAHTNNDAARLHLSNANLLHGVNSDQTRAMLNRLSSLLHFMSHQVLQDLGEGCSIRVESDDEFYEVIEPYHEWCYIVHQKKDPWEPPPPAPQKRMGLQAVLNYFNALQQRHPPFQIILFATTVFSAPTYANPME